MNLPIEIFLSFIAFAVIMGIVGLWKRIPLMMFIAGSIIVFWAITTDSIIMDTFSNIDSINVNNSTGIVEGREYIYNVNFTMSASMTTTSSAVGEFAQTNSILIGQKFQCMEVLLARTVTLPDNPIYFGIMNSTGHLTFNFTSFNPSDFTTQANQYEACLPTDTYYTIQTNDRIGVKTIVVNNARVYIAFQDSSNPYDGTISFRQGLNGAVWSGNTANDMTMKLYNITSTVVPVQTTTYEYVQQDNTFIFDAYPKILFGIISSIFMLAGALIWKYEET